MPASAKVLAETQGTVEGLILDERRADSGFGYDPHFLLPERGRTTAELSSEAKNAPSNGEQALRAMLPKSASVLQGGGQSVP